MKTTKPFLVFAILNLLLAFTIPSKPFNGLEILQESEHDFTYVGSSAPIVRARSMASNHQTVWVNEVGGELFWELTIPAAGDYALVVRYSNSDAGDLDNISVLIDDNTIGSFESENTGSGGPGWDIFVDSPVIPIGQLPAGTVILSLRLVSDDGFGIEFDKLTLTGTNIQPPPAPLLVSPLNTATNVSTNVLLDWDASIGVNTYTIQLADNPNFLNAIEIPDLTETQYLASNLEEGSTYYWQVKASNACMSGIWSDSRSFTTECLVTATILPEGPIAVCEGQSVILTGSGGNSYLWSTGETTSSIIISTEGIYSVTVSNSQTCTQSDEVELNVLDPVLPNISITLDDNSLCSGQGATFSATTTNGGAQPQFLWLVNGLISGSNSPVFSSNTLINGDTIQCQLQSSENCTTTNPVFSNAIIVSKTQAYYHPFQNFDDDVDRVKTFTNFFGGNNGIIYDTAVSQTSFLNLELNTSVTQTAFGRSLKIHYEDMNAFNIYVESFEGKWFSNNTWLNLKDLFPDFSNPAFQNRQIDSIVFFGMLDATQPLTLQVKLEDRNGQSALIDEIVQPSQQWQRFAFALQDFDYSDGFNPEFAKFIGLNFDKSLAQNEHTSGDFYLDDLYLVENCFDKPVFSDELEMLDYLNEVNFRHFWMAVEPNSKFALDRHIWDDLISVDAIGFQLSAYVIAHKNGWIAPELIENRVEHILTYLLDSCLHTSDTMQAIDNPKTYASVKGVWAHFLDNQTLARKDDRTEYSLFTSALLMGGIITAKEYFSANPIIHEKADALYRMTDWRFLERQDGLMNYDWKPESGFSPYYSDWFSEELDLAFLLGISSPEPNHRLPSNPYFLNEYRKPLCDDSTFVYSAPGANFTYYFLQMYAHFNETSNRFNNSKNALLADLAFCQSEYDALSYNALIFGTTACEGPDSAGITSIIGTDTTFISNYHAYGYCCKFDKHNTGTGTVAVYGSGSAALFIPEEVKALWKYYYNDLDELFWNEYAYRFWSPIFGMPDAFHLNPDVTSDSLINNLGFRGPWLSIPRFGIDVGPMLMNIDSYLSERIGVSSVRNYFSSDTLIAANLAQFDEITPTDILAASISINADTLSVCEGGEFVLNAIIEHGGESPIFQWFIDSVLVHSSSDSTFVFENNVTGSYIAYCVIVSSEHCIEETIATSNHITLTVFPLPQVSINPENIPDTVMLDMMPFQLTGGTPLDGFYSINGVTIDSFAAELVGLGEHEIVYTFTDNHGCSGSDTTLVTVIRPPNAIEKSFNHNFFSIFPNPTKGLVTILSEKWAGLYQLTVSDIHGRALINQKFEAFGHKEHLLDLSGLPPSVYLIFLEGDGKRGSTRITIF
ncbi:MAG: hypothetical protein DHS20C18_17120 [Saprospiraceae bacterium]|nr:MAG: hypothetical protein DHS20C18_17120 [Saprospiraceae bacterium]